MTRRSWSDLSCAQRSALVGVGAVQLALAGAAWVDLARRSPAEVRGRRAIWAGVIALNFVGPVAYFVAGRRRP